MTLIIPGVEVKVVKEVLPPQLAPSGILGLIGLTEKIPTQGLGRVKSWNRFIELFGSASAYTMPEVLQALSNGVSELVIIPLEYKDKITKANHTHSDQGNFKLESKIPGTLGNEIAYSVFWKSISGNIACDLKIYFKEKLVETHRNIKESDFLKQLEHNSSFLRVLDTVSFPKQENSSQNTPTQEVRIPLANGSNESWNDLTSDAINKLKNEPDVDMVMVSIPSTVDIDAAKEIYSQISSHCEEMSKKSQGRIGFAQVIGSSEQEISENAVKLSETLHSDRMVLVAPASTAGAVAGMIGSLDYFQSPTFKSLSIASVSPSLGVETQEALLKQNIVPVVSYQGRGIIVLRGLTSDGDQISVRRIADHAVRGVKSISELFIGRLNNEDGRIALKQKLIAFLMQMEKEGALVPSTDGSDPAFKVNVYSSQTDFAQGIVRIDMAVRPVRAIDFIYATVLVQV
ncbi:phage tail sheath C-terminal domain-containing protein [Thiolinea disciformis]|uniref:phage tail sheath C-terminal domain-containing protein n=1 Tax=Thiolinea disciformis TaxID=125614 RepID=UPI00037996C2|nr:phage tail sheath C-terminal domain-containing protein [Thiolinea disciformis]